MANSIFSGSGDSDDQIERAGSLDQEPEPQKKAAQENLKSDKNRYNGRPHRINRLKSSGRNANRSSGR